MTRKPKTVKYNRGRTSTMSASPSLYNLRKTVDEWNRVIRYLPERVDRGRELFLLEMARILVERVRALAPEIRTNGVMQKYAEDLRIGILDGGQDEDAVAIYFEGKWSRVSEGAKGNTVLYVQPHKGSPKWVEVLRKYGPWPASLLPVPLATGDARVISRNMRPDEAKAFASRLGKAADAIVKELLAAGAKDPKMEQTNYGVGVVTKEDIGYAVLRREFGFDGEQPVSHWRPAIKETMDAVPGVMEKFNQYMLTGRENVFSLPDDVSNVTEKKAQEGAQFAKVLAPFVPKR